MKNRYDGLLEQYNENILDLVPYNPFLFIIAAEEIKKRVHNNFKIMEIGLGEGHSTLPILERNDVYIDAIDISQKMIEKARQKLSKYTNRVNFICDDAYKYLRSSKNYPLIYSGWTLHNFKKEERIRLLKSIYGHLTEGGYFILMDKVYPNDDKEEFFNQQNLRYERYLPKEVAEAVIQHETEDFDDDYRIDENMFVETLTSIGFLNIEIVERVERDVVLVAQK